MEAGAIDPATSSGFMPAGGVSAMLISKALLGWLMPLQAGLGAILATVVTVKVWACGAGR